MGFLFREKSNEKWDMINLNFTSQIKYQLGVGEELPSERNR